TWNMHSLYSFFTLLLPGNPPAARVVGLVTSIAVVALVRRLQPGYGPDTLPAWYATALWGTVLASPHLFLYDVSVLVLAGLILWPARRDRDLWLGGLAIVWGTLLFSGPVTRALQSSVGAAVQISVPVLAAVGYTLLRDARPS